MKPFIDRLQERLVDFLSLDIITATSDVKGDVPNPVDLVTALSKLTMTNTKIRARTHVQISGDRCLIVPEAKTGDSSQDDILQYHQQMAEYAECMWLNRMRYIIQLMISLT